MTDAYAWSTAGLGGAILLGASVQRVSGVGFALVASPFLVALLGPFDGILVINVFAVLTSFTVFLRVRRKVEYRRAIFLMIPAVFAIIPGSWVAINMRSEFLSILIAGMIILALTASLFVTNARALSGRGGAIFAGAVSGFMSVTAGVGGPAVTAYAVATRWPQAAFAATAQLYFFMVGTVSLVAKHALPQLGGLQWIACVVALAAGIIIGDALAPHIPYVLSRIAVLVIAFAGSLSILIKAIVSVSQGA